MGTRGPKPKRGEVLWTADFAYAVGLMATDGNLSSDGRHIELTSKDEAQLITFLECIGKTAPITKKRSGFTGKEVSRVQFSDSRLHAFLRSIGLTPRKTLTIGELDIPNEYFFDFLRGHHDGDGTFYSYYDPRWKASFMFYLSFVSASRRHIDWLRERIERALGARGHITRNKEGTIFQLKYAKAEAIAILNYMYANTSCAHLLRKRLKIEEALRIVGKSLPCSRYVPR
ncbi:MAG TPA: hypothetical protein VGE23_01450 [Candidatus Paceibacterota bacterium]